jgi:DNA repair exonuclease SbcCD nuclease subunit
MAVTDYPLIQLADFPKRLVDDTSGEILRVGLLHATLNGSKIHTSSRLLTSEHYKASDFVDYDLVLLGDIHQFQYLNESKTIAYPGSLIQQSFGESIEGHGYLKWNLNDLSSELIEIPNSYGFFNFYLERNHKTGLPEISNLNELMYKLGMYPSIKVHIKDNSPTHVANEFIKKLVDDGYSVRSHIIVPYSPEIKLINTNLPSVDSEFPNLLNINYQISLIKDYLNNRSDN